MDKLITIKEAVDKLKDGMTIMVGGFLTTGGPNLIMDAIADSGINELTLICNDAAFADKGLGKLIANKQVKKLITSYIGSNPTAIELMNSSQMEIEFSPQGTLIERIRAAGAGLGGVLTPTGLGTTVENGKQVIELDDKKFILEKPIKADISFIGASISDKMGNLYYKGTTRNFNPLMAMAADVVIAEVEQIVEVGAIDPENIHTPAILVDFLIVK
ncbi:MAG: branched-chain amino acid dehydrogenase [Bacteroidetes bacterium GWF2_41_61]|nr:MAG: branched-chain amino acid dehydrogenase [Bacteroidetes bacterium GWE2_40_15]OFY29925.1 MAG: branched-chain amino acid dehydrogenase [Bacteroidetes bacterium GWF2_41_61]OFY90264.1 MAG: branched-chain amino acid dehydrogenase [Bacteroidetes bacterium RIFOXYA12_FULL_40_10]HBG24583.1 branched-chain amino acid dehydrogenase [Rikenellaceae bacterium]HBZ26374.1 branched-chain amino acid dehydrogenase [Rikenellaceae bacterium]